MLRKIEIAVLFSDKTWQEKIIEVPAAIAEHKSEDAFNAWLYYSPPGHDLQASFASGTVVGFCVMHWNPD